MTPLTQPAQNVKEDEMSKKDKPKHLGRGLQSLLGTINTPTAPKIEPLNPIGMKTPPKIQDKVEISIKQDTASQKAIREIAVDQISPNPYQPRTQWDTEKLEELSESIKANGVIQPVIVRATAGGYELIAGERRCRATQLAGLKTIPALIRQATNEEMLEIALVENIHRADLNAIERAKAYQRYIESFKINQTQAAQRLGENRSVVANYLRLLDLPQEIKDMVSNNQLSMGHARTILSIPSDEMRKKLANKALAGRLSVREVEKMVRKYLQPDSDTEKTVKQKSSHITDLENKLKRQIGTKVNIDTRKDGQRGKITIEFYSLDDFDRISSMLGVNALDGE